jgi:hypothetical protein
LICSPLEDTPDTIEYTPDGKIRVATFAKLFQKLCDPQFEGSMNDFLKKMNKENTNQTNH